MSTQTDPTHKGSSHVGDFVARDSFWREAIALHGSVTLRVMPHVVAFGVLATLIEVLVLSAEAYLGIRLGLPVAPYEIAGALVGLLLVLRNNSGYDRWWEGRKLWGGIVNQSRNLTLSALAYGPKDQTWREQFVRWAATFPHVARQSLRGQCAPEEFSHLIGATNAQAVAHSGHMPGRVAFRLARLLEHALVACSMSPYAFLQIDRERALLIDHIGACERILKTPIPLVYSIKIRRFLFLFLLTLPFALIHKIGADLWVPFVTMLVAYPLLSLDQIGIELQHPFSQRHLSHLPLNAICQTIESNLVAHLEWSDSAPVELNSSFDTKPHNANTTKDFL
jgi:ion channel-forming bestrophin family protein